MAINISRKPVGREDNNDASKGLGLLSGLALLAAPFTAGGSLALTGAAGTAAAGTTAGTLSAIGGAAGAANTISSLTQKPAEDPKQQPQGIQPVETAMGRKFSQMSQDPASQLLEAGRALNSLPPEAQNEYKPILASAYSKAKMGRV